MAATASAGEIGMNTAQTNQVRELIKEGMRALDDQSQAQLNEVRTQLQQAGEAFAQQSLQHRQQVESNKNEMAARQEEISLYVAQLEKSGAELGGQIEAQVTKIQAQLQALEGEMIRFSQDKEKIVQELTGKQNDLESFRTGLEVLTNQAEEVVHRHTGGLKFQFDEMSKGIQSQIGIINEDLKIASHKMFAMEGQI